MLGPVLQLAMQWAPWSLVMLLPIATNGDDGTAGDGGSGTAGRGGDVARQVRIEQRVQIRITARPSILALDPIFTMPEQMSRPRIRERKVGKCVTNALIGGMTLRSESELLLYLRDRRVLSATLERACRSRDFYSGFYLTRNPDGKLCVNRDTLLSRSGMNCKVKQLRELVDLGN